MPTACEPDPTPPGLRASANSKRTKYKGFIEAATDHLGPHGKFEFQPAVFSTHGELDPGCEQVISLLKQAYTTKLVAAPSRGDGATPKYLADVFECDLRDALSVAIARGRGNILVGAGLPTRFYSAIVRGRGRRARGGQGPRHRPVPSHSSSSGGPQGLGG